MRLAATLAVLAALALPAAAQAKKGPIVQAGAAVVDGTYHVGNSAGQYASTRDTAYGDVDPHAEQVKNQASYGIQSQESVRAIVVKSGDRYLAIVSDDHYIPQDALWRRTAQLLDADTGGKIGLRNLTMSVTHNHSSPSYSSLDWGVWAFQDVFDFRFFDYYAHRNAEAVEKALADLHDVRVSATVSRFDAFQKNPMGPGWADDGTPDGFPRSYTDHDLSVVRFENVDDEAHPKPLATLVNIGQHPEDLEGYDLISGEYPQAMERFVDRERGGVTLFTQNATGTSEVEQDIWHPVHDRDLFDHAQYGQMEWAARQLADAVIADVDDIDAQRPSADTAPTPYGGTSYASRFVPWMSRFPVAMDDRWFGGPISHPYPGVSSCRTDPAFQGEPRIPVVGLPDCQDAPWGDSLQPVTTLGGASPGISTDTFEALGIPVPENYSFPSTGALEDTVGVHMQAFRLGPILFTVCSCEQWVEQAYNIKTRTDRVAGDEYVGYDPTRSDADPHERCTQNGDGSWSCTIADVGWSRTKTLSDALVQHMRAQIENDAAGWDDPTCKELGCGAQAESEPTDPAKIRGNFTHDDGKDSAKHGYTLTVTISMANDYNGYIASYREFMDHDHYRKALTGWGPHSSDYFATRLSEMGRELAGDGGATRQLDGETDPAHASAGWAAMAAKEVADQAQEDAKVRAVGEAAGAAVKAYDATLANDGTGAPGDYRQPHDIQRFDAATYTWVGGDNYVDAPKVTVEREVAPGQWETFADMSGEVPITLAYPDRATCANVNAVYGGSPFDADTPDPDPTKVDPSCAQKDGQALEDGMVGYRLGGQVWKWTATFEAFVSRFPLVDPQGRTYEATPAGSYRFVVHGLWRQGNATVPYSHVSDPFAVAPWTGIAVQGLKTDPAGHVTFSAGPTHTLDERTVRNTARPPIDPQHVNAPVAFAIGPVDFPDTASDQAATGARFLDALRGYSANSVDDAEHYCLDCSFRPWLDATGRVSATVVFHTATGDVTEHLSPHDGAFVTDRALGAGETADVTIADAWGDTSGEPVTLRG